MWTNNLWRSFWPIVTFRLLMFVVQPIFGAAFRALLATRLPARPRRRRRLPGARGTCHLRRGELAASRRPRSPRALRSRSHLRGADAGQATCAGLPAGAGRARRQRRCGAATGFVGGRISCWMSPMAWNFSSPRVPYTTIGDPGLSATATPRRPERSTGMSCPSSTRTTTSWPTTACTVPRSSDQGDVSVERVDALAEGFGSDGVIVLTGVSCSFRGSPTLRFAGGPGSGWTVVAGAAATAAGSALAALFGGSAAEGLTGPSTSAVVASPEADDGAGGFV